MEHLLIFGIKNNELVHVDVAETGLECGCFCPKCNSPLIAKNSGEIREHHFAHGDDSDCYGATETVAHIMAKKIISDMKVITTPNIQYKENVISEGKEINFISVIEEERRNGYVVDVSGYPKGRDVPLCIEIRNTHEVDEEKKKKVEHNNEPMMEIDIRFVVKYVNDDLEKFKNEILHNVRNRKWINNSKAEELIKSYRKKNDNSRATKKGGLSELIKIAYDLNLKFFTQEMAEKYSDELFAASKMRGSDWKSKRNLEIEHYPLSGQIYKENLHAMGLSGERYDVFNKISTPSLMINAPREVWSSGLYMNFFHDRNIGQEITVEEISKWIRKTYGVLEPMYSLLMEVKDNNDKKKNEFDEKMNAAKTKKQQMLLIAGRKIEREHSPEPSLMSLESPIIWYLARLSRKNLIHYNSEKSTAIVRHKTLREYWSAAKIYHANKCS